MLKKLFFGLFAALFFTSAFSAEACYKYRYSSYYAWQSSATGAAADVAANWAITPTCSLTGLKQNGASFSNFRPNPGSPTPSVNYTRKTTTHDSSCNAITTDSEGTWQMASMVTECGPAFCAPPKILVDGGQCVDPPITCPSTNSTFMDNREYTFDVPAGTSLSDLDQCAPQDPTAPSGGGCTIQFEGVLTPNSNGGLRFSGMSKATTAQCEYSPTPTPDQLGVADYPPPPPETAKQPAEGTCPGEVNGEIVFVPCSFGPSTETISVTKSRANGTDTIQDTITGSNVCNASTCTFNLTNNSTSNSGGSSSKTIDGKVVKDGTGTGNGGDGEGEGEDCGAPGQPVCAVKVDEKGTPAASTATGAFANGTTEISNNKTAVEGALDGIKNSAPLPSWSWTFQLPTGCSAYPLAAYGFSIDVCEFKPMIHDLMSLLWVAAGIFGLLGLARSAFEN